MNLGQILRIINYIANKEQSGNTLTQGELNDILPKSNLELFKKKIGLPEEYKVSVPTSRIAYEVTQRLTGDVQPFKTLMGDTTTPLMVDANGYAVIPSDYYYVSYIGYNLVTNTASCGVGIEEEDVDILTDAQWRARLSNSITAPTKKHPIANFGNGTIRFRPRDLQRVEFAYLRYPTTPYYDYYIDAYDEYIFLPADSTHTLLEGQEGSAGQPVGTTVTSLTVELEWDDVCKLEIINFILDDIGINLREGQLEQYAQVEQVQGQ